MQLADVIPELGPVDVKALCSDSRKAVPGSLFFAISGHQNDGSAFAQSAVAQGAIAVVSEQAKPAAIAVPWVQCADVRTALARACRKFYRRDGSAMRYAGVTGTNGKTTTTYLLEAMLRAAGESPAVIGTIEHRLGTRRFPTAHTTPDVITLCERIAELEEAGASWVVMEVSSHGLDQKRADALRFSVAGFSNLTPDHLDYHQSMERYFEAKARLFSELLEGAGAVNIDGAGGQEMLARVKGRAISVSHRRPADVHVLQAQSSRAGTALVVRTPLGILEAQSQLIGEFNVENTGLAIGMAIGAGLSLEAIKRGIESLQGVPGRLEAVRAPDGRLGFVDYAHTPDALERVLQTLKALPHARLICVFGCGGDRDRSKRPLMGAAVARSADIAIVTSDNPRGEDPEAIIDAIVPTLRQHVRLSDRREAIRYAARIAQADDIVLIAGKGHEPYQIIAETTHHFDDREELAAAFGGAR